MWRMEAKVRKSGENQGKIAPHYHLLVWNVPYLCLLSWIPSGWFEVVGSGDPRHYNAGTRVEAVRSVKGVIYYTNKYICKAENFNLPGWGRYWGMINRQDLPGIQGEFEVIELDYKTAKTVLRYMRHLGSMCYKRGRYIGRRKVPGHNIKYTLTCDAEFWYKTLPKMLEA